MFSKSNQIGKSKPSRTKMNQKANNALKKLFEEKEICSCESCGSSFGLTFAHRKKRRHYKTVEELSDFNEVLLLCLKCHMKIEYDKKQTKELFKKRLNSKLY